jgi:hypothetical protein
MPQPTPPKVIGVEVVAAQPTEADRAAIAHLSAQANKPLPQVAYIVKIRLETIPPATSHGWALYVDDFRIPKYWEYKDGIYFKVFDQQFLADHEGEPLRFSPNGSEFIDTGMKLAAPTSKRSRGETKGLPLQSEVLSPRPRARGRTLSAGRKAK